VEITKAVSIGIEGFEEQPHCGIFCRIAHENQGSKTHSIFHIARSPAVPQVGVAEI
jgi:hypothetical protein